MPKITIITKLLRIKTIEIIHKLIERGDCKDEKTALARVLSTRAITGFDKNNLERAYQVYRKFKSKYYKYSLKDNITNNI